MVVALVFTQKFATHKRTSEKGRIERKKTKVFECLCYLFILSIRFSFSYSQLFQGSDPSCSPPKKKNKGEKITPLLIKYFYIIRLLLEASHFHKKRMNCRQVYSTIKFRKSSSLWKEKCSVKKVQLWYF